MATVQAKSAWYDEEEQGVQVGLCTETNDRKPWAARQFTNSPTLYLYKV